MNREQSNIVYNPDVQNISESQAKFVAKGIYIPSRKKKNRRPSVKTINVNLCVNVRPGRRPQIRVNVDDPTRITVSIDDDANEGQRRGQNTQGNAQDGAGNSNLQK